MAFAASTAGTYQFAEDTISPVLHVEGSEDCPATYLLYVDY